jgi:hypothetical protein
MLVAIVNHNCNANAIALRRSFLPLGPVKLIDSGSRFEPGERQHFDELLPNVYYSGLLNRVYELAATLDDAEPLLITCSDVVIAEPARLVGLMRDAFSRNPKIQIWAPSATGEGAHFRHMMPRGDKPRRVSFVDGYCFAVRKGMLSRVCPVDLRVNSLGWGIDRQLGYLAAISRGSVVVDDRISIMHPNGEGYDRNEASRQYRSWRSRMRYLARIFHGRCEQLAEGIGCTLLQCAIAALHRISPS